MRLILASSSPRRQTILKDLGIEFETKVPSNFNERTNGNPIEIVRINALGKARDVAQQLSEGVVIGCDTVIIHQGTILGKPSDENEARSMLQRLSGCWHSVMSGVAIVNVPGCREVVGIEETRVKFRDLTEEQINSYVATGEPLDKAGAYGIQGEARHFSEAMEGSYTNVVGLPKELLMKLLKIVNVNCKKLPSGCEPRGNVTDQVD